MNVIPKAIRPLIEICLNKLSKLDKSKNDGFKILTTIISKIFSMNDVLAVNCFI